MKKFLFVLSIMLIGSIGSFTKALDFTELFNNNGQPLLDSSYQKLLNDCDKTRGYDFDDPVRAVVFSSTDEDGFVFSKSVYDATLDDVQIYRLFMSPYPIEYIKNGGAIDESKFIVKEPRFKDSSEYDLEFYISSEDVDLDTTYYGFIVPIDGRDEVGMPAAEVVFNINKGIAQYDQVENLCQPSLNKKTITLKPGLNTFSTPAITKSVSFDNGGENLWFAKMKKGAWTGLEIGTKAFFELIQPLEGYLIKNMGTEDVLMTIEYDTDNSNSLMLSKDLDAGWNFLGITTTDNPFDNIANAAATMKKDLTDGGILNWIQLGKTFINATKYVLGKAYAVFVTSSNGIYGGVNNYGKENDNYDERFESCWLNPDVLCQFDDQGHLSTPETCPSYCLTEELINNVSEDVEYTKGESFEGEVFNGYFKSKKGTIGIDKINIFCGNEEGLCFNNMIFYLNIGPSNYIINNQGSLTPNNISVEENESIPISIYAYTNNSNFESIGKYVYYLRLNLSNGNELTIRLVPMYVKNNEGTFTIQSVSSKNTVLLKAINTDLATFTINPSNNDVMLEDIVLTGITADGVALTSEDIRVRVDGVEYDAYETIEQGIRYEINQVLLPAGSRVEVFLKDKHTGDVTLKVAQVNGIPQDRLFRKSYADALVYIDSQRNEGDYTQYELAVEKNDNVDKVTGLVLGLGALNNSGECVSGLTLDGLDLGDITNGDEFTIDNGSNTQTIRCIQYYADGVKYAYDVLDFTDYFRVDGAAWRVFSLGVN